MPFILFLEPLYYCNLDCPLCDRQIYPDAHRGSEAGKLSMELYDRLLDEAGDYLFQCQIYGQGEPLLDWARTRQIIEKSHRRRIFTLMSTNCTLVKPKVAEEVVGSGLDHLVCAIDGLTQETYERYRTGGRVEDAMNGLRRFVDEKRRQHRASKSNGNSSCTATTPTRWIRPRRSPTTWAFSSASPRCAVWNSTSTCRNTGSPKTEPLFRTAVSI